MHNSYKIEMLTLKLNLANYCSDAKLIKNKTNICMRQTAQVTFILIKHDKTNLEKRNSEKT